MTNIYNSVEAENTMRVLQERDQLNDMDEMVEKFQQYVASYKHHDSQSPEVFMQDMMYGIGMSMCHEYEFAVGFGKFKGRIKELIEDEEQKSRRA